MLMVLIAITVLRCACHAAVPCCAALLCVFLCAFDNDNSLIFRIVFGARCIVNPATWRQAVNGNSGTAWFGWQRRDVMPSIFLR
jgi:hypothetical protein